MIMMALMKVFKIKNNVEFSAMFMDEVLDSGINGALLESVYTFIKNVAKQEKMRVYLISHRDEIKEKTKEHILVTKSRGISTLAVNSLKNKENTEN
jgi:ABC-type branched-subunit amino acid transport system ATPase component